jgi:adenylate cyclase
MPSTQSYKPVSPPSVHSETPHPETQHRGLSPITDYYIRKLIRQNFTQLGQIHSEQTCPGELHSSSKAIWDRLSVLHADIPAISQALDALVLRHQTLRAQGGKYQTEIQQVEEQILSHLGLKRTQATPPAKILIIDDTLETLKLLTTTLVDHGYAVEQLANGASALTCVKSCQPDLILLDIMMPGVDGYEVCERLKLDPQTCHIPILFLSAIGSATDKVKAFDMGGVDYITKPFQLEEVLARVEYQLKLYQIQQCSQHQLDAERTYQAFFENAIDGMFQTTLNGKFLRANQALAALLGYNSPAELMQSVQDIARQLYTIPQRRAQFVLYLEQYGQTEEFEAEVFRQNGDRIWIRETARAVRDAEGTLKFYEGTVQDITAQKHLETSQGDADLAHLTTQKHLEADNIERARLTPTEHEKTFDRDHIER